MKELNEITILLVLYEEEEDMVFKSLELIKEFRIIILDNKNNKILKKKIENKYQIEKYIISKKNLGYSKGYNKILNICKTKYAFVKNIDCFIDKNNILKLYHYLKKNENCGIVSPTSFNNQGEHTYNGGLLPENEKIKVTLRNSGDVCVQKVLGAALFFKLEDIKKIGMFNDNLFIYFSDDELCKNLIKINKHVVQIANSICIHVHGISKIKNMYKKIFIREMYYTLDELIYYKNINQTKYINLKLKLRNYFFKIIINIFSFNLSKSIKYYSKLYAFIKFKLLNV